MFVTDDLLLSSIVADELPVPPFSVIRGRAVETALIAYPTLNTPASPSSAKSPNKFPASSNHLCVVSFEPVALISSFTE